MSNSANSRGANGPSSRAILTVACSVFFTLTTNRLADARDILRGGYAITPTTTGNTGKTNPTNTASQQAAANATRAQDTLRRTAQAMQSVQALQNSARAAAKSGPNNLGTNPNNPAQQLPNIPDGLTPEGSSARGLQVAPGVNAELQNPEAIRTLWLGAKAPTQSVANGQTNVTITQTNQQALLNWQTFDIGKNTTLTFDQSAGGTNIGAWIAFNKINDPTGIPSQILGSIKAGGQVYVINQNGIIFGGGSQVNAHALVASSLPINDNLLSSGLLNNPEKQFLFSSLDIPKVTNGTMSAFTAPAAPNTPNGQQGPVQVQAGATLESPTTADHVGGRVVLVGPSVSNAGTISTPDGQTILAAGQQVGFSESSDPTLRGLNVFIGQGEGVATNAAGAYISAPRANVTIAAKNVNQLGYIYSTTSVSYNGRIDLLANYNAVADPPAIQTDSYSFYPTASGLVTLGAGSVTEIVPETWSSESIPNTTLTLGSKITIEGLGLYMGCNSVIHAPSAKVELNAGNWYFYDSSYVFKYTGGQVYLDSGALIDVAGTQNVDIPVTRNIVSVQLRGSELADSPVQRNGLLRGTTVMVDARVGTPLGNAQGWIDLIQRTVGELTIAGGSVAMNAGGSVVMQQGSRIDISGGWINYQGGNVQTTRLISGGHIYDISQAAADLVYDGIYAGFTTTHPKWSISETFTSPLLSGAHYEQGYIQGANSGSISVTAPGMALDGSLYGNAVMGPRQRASAPSPGSLALLFQKIDETSPDFTAILPNPPNVTFQTLGKLQAVDPFTLDAAGVPAALRTDRLADVILSPDLVNANGFGKLTIDISNDVYGTTNGGTPPRWITVAADVSLSTPAGGAITLTAPNINIEGSIFIPGGALSLSALNISASQASVLNNTGNPAYNAARGNITLGSNTTLSTAGLIVDDRTGAASPELEPLVKKGGAISIIANNANLQAGSVIDVSGGLLIAASGKKSYGDGGSVTIQTGQDANIKSVLGGDLTLLSSISGYSGLQDFSFASADGSQALLGANLRFSGGGTGGALNIQARQMQIGGNDPHNGTFYVSTDFFNQGGFNTFSLSGIGAAADQDYLPALVIAPDTHIEPAVKNRLFLSGVKSELSVIQLPQGSRKPVNLSFTALNVTNSYPSQLLVRGDLVMGDGASIQTDPLGNVNLQGDTVSLLGSIFAPGGAVTITGAKSYPSNSTIYTALPTVYIGPKSHISAVGATLLVPDSRGYRSGSVLKGGDITVSGNIVAAPGSILNVSGASGILDLAVAYSGESYSIERPTRLATKPVSIDSDGGAISLKGSEELFSNATLIGAAGGSGAKGGSVSISSGRFYMKGANSTTADINLSVTQSDSPVSAAHLAMGSSLLGNAVVDSLGAPIQERGYFAIDHLANGGFDSVTLDGNVEFLGTVNVTSNRNLTVAMGGILSANGDVTLNAPYVTLGQPFVTPMQSQDLTAKFLFTKTSAAGGTEEDFPKPSYGAGSLTVNASYIDIGNLSLQNIGKANFFADNGDIRGDGTLDVAGHITLRAGQIFPASAVSFTIAAYDYTANGLLNPGSVSIESSGVRQTPLSAGGSLSIFGSNIRQAGVLRAPLGQITLGCLEAASAPTGDITNESVAVTQQLTLAAGSVTSVSAFDSVTGQWLTIPYGLNNNGSQWIDPKGTDISLTGLAAKKIETSGVNLTVESNATIDIRGGGDLYSYRWVNGPGGSKDILASASSFAVIPGYQSDAAPYAPFSSGPSAKLNLGGNDSKPANPGYVNSDLKIGDKIYLEASPELAAGFYTLLPARYALLPGAVLVTKQSGSPTGTVSKTDGSHLVSGYRYNSLGTQAEQPLLNARFEVVSSATLRERSKYEDYFANAFLRQSASDNSTTVQRLPVDSGQLILAATYSMALDGSVLSKALTGGRGGFVDINSPVDILVSRDGAVPQNGKLVLDATKLSGFGAESLLIGGVRDALGTTVQVNTDNLTVDNSGSALTGPDVILVSNKSLTIAESADIEQRGDVSSPTETLNILHTLQLKTSGDSITLPQAGAKLTFSQGTPGSNKIISTSAGTITKADGTTTTLAADTATSISAGATVTLINAGSVSFVSGGTDDAIPITVGDGLLLRVSADANANIARTNVNTFGSPKITIGAGARLSGNSIIVDSTYATDLSPAGILNGKAVSLNSGQISIDFNSVGQSGLKLTAGKSTVGLVLSGNALKTMVDTANSLSLLSYSSVDIYGSGAIGNANFQKLALHTADIRGFDAGNVSFAADTILLDNSTGGIVPAHVDGQNSTLSGALAFHAGTLELGLNTLNVELFHSVELNASRMIVAQSNGGFVAPGALTLVTPVLTGATTANGNITANGVLKIQRPDGASVGTQILSLGASLTLKGASVEVNSDIVLPSGLLELHATAGDILIANKESARIDVGGTEERFFDLIKYTSGGEISLTSDTGKVSVGSEGIISVAAQPEGANAGSLLVSAAKGDFFMAGTMSGQGGNGGNFSLDVRSLANTASLDSVLNAASFSQSRNFRVRSGSVLVDGIAKVHSYSLSVDAGAIDLVGTVDASGAEGGTISLQASGGVTLLPGSILSVAGEDFSNAGKGGAVSLETRGVNGGIVDIQTGSTIDLRVTSNTSDKVASNASIGYLNGTLHLRAPQTADSKDLQVGAINGSILGASSIAVEGYKVYTPAAGSIDSVKSAVLTNGNTFVGTAGATTSSYTTMLNRLLGSNTGLASVLSITPGAEIVNQTGDLTLGTASSAATSDWNLATYRFGPKNAPGFLTLRAAGNLVFYNALSDGFTLSTNTAKLLAQNPLLPVNAQSWTYRLTAGADFSAADYHRVLSMDRLSSNAGSLLLGKDGGKALASTSGASATTASAITPSGKPSLYQVIRTGSGDIDISLGRNLQLLNQFATIYTAGTQVADPTSLFTANDFVLPIVDPIVNPAQSALGVVQQDYLAQYSMAGGNVTINAQWDMLHLTKASNVLVADSERQMPNNWLYRRGFVDATGQFGAVSAGNGLNVFTDPAASTTWWVDFSNFFEGIAALGGGNVTLVAGHDISNIDAAVPTNARMPKGTPDASKLVELGGGDLVIRAGHDIDAGVYYVERGHGSLTAGNTIHTNSTRSPSLTNLGSATAYEASSTWLPTTLFLGKGGFDISASGDVLLGPVANLFWCPQGGNNKFWNKTYFNTYSPESYVNVSSLGGDISFREKVNINTATPILQVWMDREMRLVSTSAAYYQPWLRLAESQVIPFSTVLAVLPPTLRATSFSGDINIVGNLTLFPSTQGTIDLAAVGSINGLQKTGINTNFGLNTTNWNAAVINLSDADPASLPGIATPYTYGAINSTDNKLLQTYTTTFSESGSQLLTLSAKQARHASSPLHANDALPVHLYSTGGDISGLTLFSGKFTSVAAGNDVTDIALYIQNLVSSDVSVVSAGRDIIAYNPNSPLRTLATSEGNSIIQQDVTPSGDVQIAGPGSLQVLAGRNLDLGVKGSTSTPSDTNLGILSIGNARNPNLPSVGADIIAMAGIGGNNSTVDFDTFVTQFMNPTHAGAFASTYLPEILPQLAQYLPSADISNASEEQIWSAFNELTQAQQEALALDTFYRILRDAGRNYQDSTNPGYNYKSAYSAIAALFPGNTAEGDISLTSREIKTKAGVSSTDSEGNPLYSGGNITLMAPGGKVEVGLDVTTGQAIDQGIFTEHGGGISIFAKDSVSVGTSRIFTLRGGNLIIWSTTGNIAAGSSSKTVKSAPPTRVLIDPQSTDTKADLGGLATGGGIGVLAAVQGVPTGEVDLIAPSGNIDAGDAGIRATGNLHVAALQVLNASNIQVGGISTGTPAAPAPPNISGMSTAANASAAATSSADTAANTSRNQAMAQAAQDMPSLITVEVLGYGGGEEVNTAAPSVIPTPLATPAPSAKDDEADQKRL